jgi:uncharacterized membrane protein YeaQ/YmgE (transglycosylase-associated protein family)
MSHLAIVLADGITIKLGTYIWTFGWNFVLYLAIAAIVGLVAESVMRSRLPLGFVGAIAAALIGIWLMTQVIVIKGIGDFYLFGIPIVRALIGALVLTFIWRLIAFALFRGRNRTVAV